MMLTPKVFAAGTRVALAWPGLTANHTYHVRFYSLVSDPEDTRADVTTDADGVLRLQMPVPTRGEYRCELFLGTADKEPWRSESLFAVPAEWLTLRPFRGDLHLHTTASDGKDTALAMATAAQATGLDFIAITDHDVHPAALPAVNGLVVLPGEEVTIREVGGHILSLGATAGVGKLRHSAASDAERAALEVARPLAPPLTPAGYAHAAWTLRKIHEFGGLAVIAHPCWKSPMRKYYPPPAVVAQLLEDGLVDGLELLGGSPDTEGNRLAIARYGEELRRGRHLAVTGGSDAHAVGELGRYGTLLFAPALTPAGILDALRQRRTLACEPRPEGQVAMYGPFEWVEYAYFLHREYFHRPFAERERFWPAPGGGLTGSGRAPIAAKWPGTGP